MFSLRSWREGLCPPILGLSLFKHDADHEITLQFIIRVKYSMINILMSFINIYNHTIHIIFYNCYYTYILFTTGLFWRILMFLYFNPRRPSRCSTPVVQMKPWWSPVRHEVFLIKNWTVMCRKCCHVIIKSKKV